MALQVRRGTNAERLTITPAEGELIYVTDTKQLYVGDGTTQGGTTTIANTIDSVLADTTPQLGGNLDLNNFNITGTGNINISGTINATGNINLGDGVGGDVITIGGAISGDLVPDTNITRDLGTNVLKWKEAWISQLNVDSQITAERIQADIIADDSTVVFDSSTGTVAAAQLSGTLPAGVIPSSITADLVGNVTGNIQGDVIGDLTGNVIGNVTGGVTGDVTGSVFADDSSMMVDAVSNTLNANLLTVNGTITGNEYVGQTATFEDRTTDNQGTMTLRRKVAGTISDNKPYGLIYFSKDDNAGALTTTIIQGGETFFRVVNDPAGVGSSQNPIFNLTFADSKLGVGYRNIPGDERLQVNGDASIAGYIANDQIKIQGNQIATTVSNANLELTANGTGTIELTVPTQTTVGAAGAANALPATPSTYFKINVAGTEYVVPAYAVS